MVFKRATWVRRSSVVPMVLLGVFFGCRSKPDVDVVAVQSALTTQPAVAGGQCGFVEQLASGDVLYAIKFTVAQAYVEVFQQQNGVQNIAKAMAGDKNADGTFTYRMIVPASTYKSGDKILARFYSYAPNQPGVYTPGPNDTTFLPQLVYGSATCAENVACSDFLNAPTYVQQLTNGNLQFSVTLPTGQQYVEVFVQQNDVQTIAQNIVGSAVANADGTKTYSLVSAASKYKAGDKVLARFYSYLSNSSGVYTPGSTDDVWAPLFVYSQSNACAVQCAQQTCSGNGNCTNGATPGQLVCNCAAGFQGPSCSTPGGGTVVSAHPPRALPPPPRIPGCYAGTANGWASIPCAAPGTMGETTTAETSIETPNGPSTTVPYQFGQVETTLTAFGSESDSSAGANAMGLQGNTGYFKSTAVPSSIPGSTVGDQAWVQFDVLPAGGTTTLKIETWDLATWNSSGKTCKACLASCGCIDHGLANVANRSTGFTQFDFATVAGSVYNDASGNPLLGMVTQFSWYDPKNDPNNNRGLYAVVAPDEYGLASGNNWKDFSGTLLGLGGGSTGKFTNSSVLTRTLVGNCDEGSKPIDGVPWPGLCSSSPDLLPSTTTVQVTPTGENNNLCEVGTDTPLVASNENLVWTQNLYSTSCTPVAACISTADRLFVRSTDEDTGVRPINFGAAPFWESPNLLVVPTGTLNVNVDFVSSETVLTPGSIYDVYVRVNNDFSCAAMTGAKALVYIADPSALSAQWVSITGGSYQGNVTVPAGQQGLLGPYTFTAPADIPANGGHKCLLAAIAADNEAGPANTTNPLKSFQVGQRNLQFSNCVVPLTNGTQNNGKLSLILTATGAAPALTGTPAFSVAFDDPMQVFFGIWSAKQGTAYSVNQSGGKTTVRLGQASVTLDPIPLNAGTSFTGAATVDIAQNDPQSALQVAAQLTDATTGAVLVSNGLSCASNPPIIQ